MFVVTMPPSAVVIGFTGWKEKTQHVAVGAVADGSVRRRCPQRMRRVLDDDGGDGSASQIDRQAGVVDGDERVDAVVESDGEVHVEERVDVDEAGRAPRRTARSWRSP